MHNVTLPAHRVNRYDLVRSKVPKLGQDRYIEPDIRAISKLIRDQEIVRAVMPEWEIGK